MKFTNCNLLALASSVAVAQWNGGPMNWGGMGGSSGWASQAGCAATCFSSAWPTATSAWSSYCATPTSLPSCISSACSGTTSIASSFSSIQSSLCSVYSSCSTATSCSAWPWGGWGDGSYTGGWGPMGGNGWYTYSCTDGRTSGFTTRTITVTTTANSGGTSTTSVLTSTQTATLVAAAVTNTGASATATSTKGAAAPGKNPNAVGALAVAALGAFIAL